MSQYDVPGLGRIEFPDSTTDEVAEDFIINRILPRLEAGESVDDFFLPSEGEQPPADPVPTDPVSGGALGRGLNTLETSIAFSQHALGQSTTDDLLDTVEQLREERKQYPLTPEYQKFQESKGWINPVLAFAEAPLSVGPSLGAESAVTSGAGIILGLGATAATGGNVIVGAAVGGLTEGAVEFGMAVAEELSLREYNTREELRQALDDPDLMGEIYEAAAKKSVVVGAFGLGSFLAAGKILGPVFRAVLGSGKGKIRKAVAGTVAGAAELTVEAAFEGAGEGLSTLYARGHVEGKEVVAEVIGSIFFGGPVEVGGKLLVTRPKMTRVSRNKKTGELELDSVDEKEIRKRFTTGQEGNVGEFTDDTGAPRNGVITGGVRIGDDNYYIFDTWGGVPVEMDLVTVKEKSPAQTAEVGDAPEEEPAPTPIGEPDPFAPTPLEALRTRLIATQETLTNAAIFNDEGEQTNKRRTASKRGAVTKIYRRLEKEFFTQNPNATEADFQAFLGEEAAETVDQRFALEEVLARGKAPTAPLRPKREAVAPTPPTVGEGAPVVTPETPLFHASPKFGVTLENAEVRNGAIWFSPDSAEASDITGTKGGANSLVGAKLRADTNILDPANNSAHREILVEAVGRAQGKSNEESAKDVDRLIADGELWEAVDSPMVLSGLRERGFDAVVASEGESQTVAVMNKEALGAIKSLDTQAIRVDAPEAPVVEEVSPPANATRPKRQRNTKRTLRAPDAPPRKRKLKRKTEGPPVEAVEELGAEGDVDSETADKAKFVEENLQYVTHDKNRNVLRFDNPEVDSEGARLFPSYIVDATQRTPEDMLRDYYNIRIKDGAEHSIRRLGDLNPVTGFFMRTMKVLETTSRKSGNVQAWLNTFRKGDFQVSQAELNFLGLEQWMTEFSSQRGGAPIDRASIKAYIEQNSLKIEEIELGDPSALLRTRITNARAALDRQLDERKQQLSESIRQIIPAEKFSQLIGEPSAESKEDLVYENLIGPRESTWAENIHDFYSRGSRDSSVLELVVLDGESYSTPEEIWMVIWDEIALLLENFPNDGINQPEAMAFIRENWLSINRLNAEKSALEWELIKGQTQWKRAGSLGFESLDKEHVNYRQFLFRLKPRTDTEIEFTEGHFRDVPNNIFGTVFLSDRYSKGRRLLFIEEIQSDWYAEIKKIQEDVKRWQGVRADVFSREAAIMDWINPLLDEYPFLPGATAATEGAFQAGIDAQLAMLTTSAQGSRWEELHNFITSDQIEDIRAPRSGETVEERFFRNAQTLHEIERQALERYKKAEPFVDNWEKFILRRITHLAVEEGYDGIAWASANQIEGKYSEYKGGALYEKMVPGFLKKYLGKKPWGISLKVGKIDDPTYGAGGAERAILRKLSLQVPMRRKRSDETVAEFRILRGALEQVRKRRLSIFKAFAEKASRLKTEAANKEGVRVGEHRVNASFDEIVSPIQKQLVVEKDKIALIDAYNEKLKGFNNQGLSSLEAASLRRDLIESINIVMSLGAQLVAPYSFFNAVSPTPSEIQNILENARRRQSDLSFILDAALTTKREAGQPFTKGADGRYSQNVNEFAIFNQAIKKDKFEDPYVSQRFQKEDELLPHEREGMHQKSKLSEAEQEEIAEDIKKLLSKIAPGADVGFFEGLIRDRQGRLIAGGFIDKLIAIALDPRVDARNTAYHETFHWLEAGKFFPPKALRLIEASREKLLDIAWNDMSQFMTDKELTAYFDTDSAAGGHEILAIAGAYYLRNKEQLSPETRNLLEILFENFKQLLDRTRNYLNGLGFQTIEDIFDAVGTGEIGHRTGRYYDTVGTDGSSHPMQLEELGWALRLTKQRLREFFQGSVVVDPNDNPIPLYHGTTLVGEGTTDLGLNDPNSLYGAGIYMNDTASIAAEDRYTNNLKTDKDILAEIAETKTQINDVVNAIDLIKAGQVIVKGEQLTPFQQDEYLAAYRGQLSELQAFLALLNQVRNARPAIFPVYTNISNPLDATAPLGVKVAQNITAEIRASNLSNEIKEEALSVLSEVGSLEEAVDLAPQLGPFVGVIARRMGYDGIVFGAAPAVEETVAEAAIKLEDDTVYTGVTHFHAAEAASESLGFDVIAFVQRGRQGGFVEGFTTSTGRFITREEALEITGAPREKRSTLFTAEDLRIAKAAAAPVAPGRAKTWVAFKPEQVRSIWDLKPATMDLSLQASLRVGNNLYKRLKNVRSDLKEYRFNDLGNIATWINSKRHLAHRDEHFASVFTAIESGVKERENFIHTAADMLRNYGKTNDKDRHEIDKALELFRLQSAVPKLQKGRILIVNTSPDAELTQEGELVALNLKQSQIFMEYDHTMRWILKQLRDSVFRSEAILEFPEGNVTLDPEMSSKDLFELVERMRQAIKTGELEGLVAVFGNISDSEITDKFRAAFSRAIEDVEGLANRIKQFEFYGQTTYVPFMRFGDRAFMIKSPEGKVRHLSFIDAKANMFSMLKNQGKIEQRRQELADKYNVPLSEVKDFIPTYDTLRHNISETFLQDLELLSGMVTKNDSEDHQKAMDAIKREYAKRGSKRHLIQAKMTPGYSTDFKKATGQYIMSIAKMVAHLNNQRAINEAVTSIPTNKPNTLKAAHRFREYMGSSREEWGRLRAFGFSMYLGGNLSSGLLQVVTLPEFTLPFLSQFAPTTKVAKELARSIGFTTSILGKSAVKWSKGETLPDIYLLFDPKDPRIVKNLTEDERGATNRAWNEGYITAKQTLEHAGIDPGARMALFGQRNYHVRELLATTFNIFETSSRYAAFLTAYRLAQDPAVRAKAAEVMQSSQLWQQKFGNNPTAYDIATFTVEETFGVYGKVDRPDYMRGFGSALFQFMSYPQKMIELMARMYASQGRAGKKAFAFSMIMLAMAGGMWGLPLGEDLKDLLEALWKKGSRIAGRPSDLDLDRYVREMIVDTTGAPIIAEVLSRGVGRIIGVNISRRASLGTLPVGDMLKVIVGIRDSFSDALGVPGSLFLGNTKNMMKRIDAGENPLTAVTEIMPSFARNIYQSLAWSGALESFNLPGGARSTKNNVLVTKEDLTSADLLMKLIGFEPAKVTQAREHEFIVSREIQNVKPVARIFRERLIRSIEAQMLASATGNKENRLSAAERMRALFKEIQSYNSGRPVSEWVIIDLKAMAREAFLNRNPEFRGMMRASKIKRSVVKELDRLKVNP